MGTSAQITIGLLLLVLAALVVFSILKARRLSSERQHASRQKEEIESLDKRLRAALGDSAALREKYEDLISIDDELENRQATLRTLDGEIAELQGDYRTKKEWYNRLVEEAAIYNEQIQLADQGFYAPHFDFGTSEKYKDSIREIRDLQKTMVSDKTAVVCHTEWTTEGSRAKGRTMENRQIRLTARAFNSECDAAISNARWNNMLAMEKRIAKSHEALNKLNASMHITISEKYRDLKITELHLAHEYQEKKKREREEQAAIRRQMREEAKLKDDAEKAGKDAARYQELLDKAKREAGKASDQKLEALNARIGKLSEELAAAQEKRERAKSMAEQTKSGHVYIVSNIGSFGENIYKIGMTRRLDPMDRVKELGDASVPYVFDVHAMIYAEDAPAVENALHRSFDERRLNLVNRRKEFFAVTLDEITEEVSGIFPDAEVIETIEARDFRESEAIRAQRQLAAASPDARTALPDEI